MEITPTTPGLLFPAISLLLLAYTNRFLSLANVIRQLGQIGQKSEGGAHRQVIFRQVTTLRRRLQVIRWMQAFGVMSFVMCTLSMFALFLSNYFVGQLLFGLSLVLLTLSLLLSLYEVNISTDAINMEIERFESAE